MDILAKIAAFRAAHVEDPKFDPEVTKVISVKRDNLMKAAPERARAFKDIREAALPPPPEVVKDPITGEEFLKLLREAETPRIEFDAEGRRHMFPKTEDEKSYLRKEALRLFGRPYRGGALMSQIDAAKLAAKGSMLSPEQVAAYSRGKEFRNYVSVSDEALKASRAQAEVERLRAEMRVGISLASDLYRQGRVKEGDEALSLVQELRRTHNL